MINVISKKTLEFKNGNETYKVNPLEYSSIPDWCAKDLMFQWAKSDGTLTVAGEKENKVSLKK